MCQGEFRYRLIIPQALLSPAPAFWELCSPRCAQWSENLRLPASWSTCSKISALFLGHQPGIQPLLFGLCIPLLLYHDFLRILGGFLGMHTLNGLGNFMSVLKVNIKFQTSWFAWFCGGFWVKWIAYHFLEATFSCLPEKGGEGILTPFCRAGTYRTWKNWSKLSEHWLCLLHLLNFSICLFCKQERCILLKAVYQFL